MLLLIKGLSFTQDSNSISIPPTIDGVNNIVVEAVKPEHMFNVPGNTTFQIIQTFTFLNQFRLKKVLLIVYAGLSILLLFDVFIWYRHHFNFRGYWTDRIVLWLWVINACILIGTQWKQASGAHALGKILEVIGVYSIAPMMFPVILLSSKLMETDNISTQKLSPSYRLDEVRQKPFRVAKILLIEHQVLLEKEIATFYADTAIHYYSLQDALQQAGIE